MINKMALENRQSGGDRDEIKWADLQEAIAQAAYNSNSSKCLLSFNCTVFIDYCITTYYSKIFAGIVHPCWSFSIGHGCFKMSRQEPSLCTVTPDCVSIGQRSKANVSGFTCCLHSHRAEDL